MAESNPVAGTVAALQSAYNLTKGIADLNEVHAIKTQIGKLTAQILTAQENALLSQEREATLARQVNGLEQHIAQLETWETEKQRYQLESLPPGAHVYSLKEEMAAGEPAHHICPTCYQHGKKSILHQSETNNGTYHLECSECGTDLKVGHFKPPRIERDGGSWTRR